MTLYCKTVSRNVMEVLNGLRWIFLLMVLTDSVIGHVSDGSNLLVVQDGTGVSSGGGIMGTAAAGGSLANANVGGGGSSIFPSTTSSASSSASSSSVVLDAPKDLLSPPFTLSSNNNNNNNLSSSNGSKLSDQEVDEQQKLLELQRKGLPWIDKAASPNVTALLGKTAYLNCRVKNLADKTVSWIRHRDIHLLTVGRYTYTTDQRFRSVHQPSTEDYSLVIKYPQHRDSGIYECQVSTTPHTSHYIHLHIVEPVTEVAGGPDVYIDRGSTINLTCTVKYSPEPPLYIIWNHNDAIISYNSPRGGVSVLTEKGDTTISYLLIQRAKPSDSGRYTCGPSNSNAHSINVHVLNGELPAAMQTGGQMPQQIPLSFCLLSTIILLMI